MGDGEVKSEFKLQDAPPGRKERNFPALNLQTDANLNSQSANLNAQPGNLNTQPVLVIQSPKTPTLSRKLKAVSLDSEPQKGLDVCRDVFSMPNTPKKQLRAKLSCDLDEGQRSSLTPGFSSNLKRFGSNTSISGSQTLKTLPEIMTLQDFSDNKTEPIRIKAKGLLERRGSNASLTIDLGSNTNLSETRRLNTAKSVSNLNLSWLGEKCCCAPKRIDRRKSQTHIETCGNCTIYEFVATKTNVNTCRNRCPNAAYKRCNTKCRRKSLSNENLYVPPCSFCQNGSKEHLGGATKGYRKACYPRQPDLDVSQLLSEDFKLHLQNVQYLQTAGSVLSVSDLKLACDAQRLPKLHQEFWEVPLNLQEKCLVSGSQSRNRYRGVLPNEHSRVHLPGEQPYIHANYIKGPDYTETLYIATQGPMAHTCADFWEMVWSNKSTCIVMLTNLIEKGRNKCELYFPLGKKTSTPDAKSYFRIRTLRPQDKFTFENTKDYVEETVQYEEVDQVEFGDYKIKYISENVVGECTVRDLQLFKTSENAERPVKHYWFPTWQDHKMCNPEQVLKIAERILGEFVERRKNSFDQRKQSFDSFKSFTFKQNMEKFERGGEAGKRKEKKNVPIVVHCSAGIGRTGCFLAILNGIQQLKNNFNVDILAILCSLRLHRGGMVQTAEQYELIHRVLSLYADSDNIAKADNHSIV